MQQDASPPAMSGEPKPPTQHTLEFNALYRESLPFGANQDFEDARRGLIASLPEPVVIRNADGAYLWDLNQYAFIGVDKGRRAGHCQSEPLAHRQAQHDPRPFRSRGRRLAGARLRPVQ